MEEEDEDSHSRYLVLKRDRHSQSMEDEARIAAATTFDAHEENSIRRDHSTSVEAIMQL